jgi:hypothetical protein
MKAIIYVVNIKENTEVRRARQEFFIGDVPCSTLVEVRSPRHARNPRRGRGDACIGAGKRAAMD